MRHARSSTSGFLASGNLAVRGIFAAGLLCLVAGAGLWVAQPVTADPAADNGVASVDDIQFTVQARQFLNQDAQLQSVNLGVVVRGRVATLSGPVPSADISRRAEERLRQLTGVVKVVNELWVERPEDAPQPPIRIARPQRPPAQEQPGRDVLTVHTASPPRTPSQGPPAGGDPTIQTFPTIRLSVPGKDAPAVDTAKPLLPFAEDRQAQLVQQVERIRTADARFRGIQAEVADGVVLLRGTVARGEDQIDFAEKLSRVPGVTRVVLAGMRVER